MSFFSQQIVILIINIAGLTNTVLKAKVLPEDEEDDEGHEHERDDDPDQDAKNWSELQGNWALWK